MILYETTFIVNPQSDEAVIEAKVKAISELILSNGGKIVYEDRMGTRRLAYPINKLHQGYYATFLHESDKSVLPLLERHMKLSEEYMRHLTIKFEADPERVYGDKKEDYRAPREIRKREPDSDSEKEPATEEADSLSETAEIKIVPSPEDAATDEKEPVSEVPATEEADSASETTKIEIVSPPEETSAEEKRPSPNSERPDDEEL